jgi:hypothetical protein
MGPIAAGKWWCPCCSDKKVFVLWDEPWDENLAQCEACGYSFGYAVQVSQRLDPHGKPEVVAAPRPVLSPEVLRAGMLELNAENMERLAARHGEPVVWATKKLKEGLAEPDRTKRAQMLGAQLPGRAK